MNDSTTRPFGEYGVSSRTFRVKCTRLIVSHRWARESSSFGEDSGSSILIQGKAITEKERVRVIGKEGPAISEFNLTLRSDADVEHSWKKERESEEFLTKIDTKIDSNAPELWLRDRIFERLNENPPTAYLCVTEPDWELGVDGRWWIQCEIPSSLLTRFETEIPVQRISELYLDIQWEGGLVHGACHGLEEDDIHGIWTWGLLTLGQLQSVQPLRGHVKFISWDIPNQSGVPDQSFRPEQLQTQPRNIEGEIDRLGGTLACYMQALTRNCAIGFFAAIALILVCYFLR